MTVVLLVVGLLLVLFGGGCVVLAGMIAAADPEAITNPARLADLVVPVTVLGILPLAAGSLMIWSGIRRQRRRSGG